MSNPLDMAHCCNFALLPKASTWRHHLDELERYALASGRHLRTSLCIPPDPIWKQRNLGRKLKFHFL
jgi:hypothetical protein